MISRPAYTDSTVLYPPALLDLLILQLASVVPRAKRMRVSTRKFLHAPYYSTCTVLMTVLVLYHDLPYMCTEPTIEYPGRYRVGLPTAKIVLLYSYYYSTGSTIMVLVVVLEYPVHSVHGRSAPVCQESHAGTAVCLPRRSTSSFRKGCPTPTLLDTLRVQPGHRHSR